FAVDQGDDDASRVGGWLLPHEDEVSVLDLVSMQQGKIHRVASNPQEEELRTRRSQKVLRYPNDAFPVLLRKHERTSGCGTDDRDGLGLQPRVRPSAQANATSARPALNVALFLEPGQVPEDRSVRADAEALLELGDRRRHAELHDQRLDRFEELLLRE